MQEQLIKALAIDDEPLALRQLEAYIKQVPFLELVASCNCAHEARQALEQHDIDVMFVDINMPDFNGLDFVRQLVDPPMVVFTTAYSEYAVEGYKVDAVDYLLKPFDLDDFKRAAEKVRQRYDMMNGNDISRVDDDDAIFIKSDYKIARVEVSKIRYIEAMSEYLRIHIVDRAKPYTVLMSMKKIEENLPQYFMRIHRSYIINLRRIVEVNRNHIVMGDDASLPIGELYKDAFMTYLNKKFITR